MLPCEVAGTRRDGALDPLRGGPALGPRGDVVGWVVRTIAPTSRPVDQLRPIDDRFEAIAPFIEADIEAAEVIGDLQNEIEAGRISRDTEPLLSSGQAFARARAALKK